MLFTVIYHCCFRFRCSASLYTLAFAIDGCSITALPFSHDGCFYALIPVLTGTFNCSLVKIQYECDHGGYLYGATPDRYVGGKIPRFNVSVCSYGVGCLHSWTVICVIIDFICQVSRLGRLLPQNLPVSAILTVGMNLCARFT